MSMSTQHLASDLPWILIEVFLTLTVAQNLQSLVSHLAFTMNTFTITVINMNNLLFLSITSSYFALIKIFYYYC